MTHGHWDHMGALPAAIDAIVQQGGRVTVHVSPGHVQRARRAAEGRGDHPGRQGPASGRAGAARGNGRQQTARSGCCSTGSSTTAAKFPRVTPFEKGRVDHLCRTGPNAPWQPDPFLMDERMLVVHVRDLGLIVFSACSHAGIVNVCTEVRNLFPDIPIHCVMGGLHLGGVMEGIIPDTVDGVAAVRHQIHHQRPLHRVARLARAGQRLRRRRQPVGGRHQLYLCRR